VKKRRKKKGTESCINTLLSLFIISSSAMLLALAPAADEGSSGVAPARHTILKHGLSRDGAALAAMRGFAREAAACGDVRGCAGLPPLPALLVGGALETAEFLGQDRRPGRDADGPARSPTPEDVRANTLSNAKRQREAETAAEAAEQADSKRQRQRGTHVRFERAVRVRDMEEEHEECHAEGACTEQDCEAAQRATAAVRDHHVDTKLIDGPNIISQVVSSLLIAIAQRRPQDAETIMWTIHTTLLKHGWTSISCKQEMDILARTYGNLERLEKTLLNNGHVAVLPGAIRLSSPTLPLLKQLQVGIHQAALRIATMQYKT